ncbi:hypothetical protein KP509_26G006700 [Ceratopteris richardii]|uniref:Chromo domain-containing protein n=1 Tax=Ceratopteris richardii TaxID=49495 RepID=A0A8T2RK14_CERRI|nr:hypothetical protein KP509_26G006700 [Ceratopteris richardii]
MDIHRERKEEIHKAQEQYKYYADQHLWLLRNNLQTSRPCAKLDHQRCGPFIILAKVNPVTFKLQPPNTMRIHLVFHGERPSPSQPIEIDDHEEFEIEHVLDSRISRGRLEYLIHWKGYDISDHTWEHVENLQRALIKVQEFHKRNPMKLRPDNMTSPHGTRRLRGR